MDFFGLKGRWIRTFLVSLGVLLVPAILAGTVAGIGIAVGVVLGGGGFSFLGCMLLQARTPERRLDKAKLESKMERHVVRRENLSRILLSDERWELYDYSRRRQSVSNRTEII